MAGVVDIHGVQWEHCSVCTEMIPFDELKYRQPNENFEFGVDQCEFCEELTDQEVLAIQYIIRLDWHWAMADSELMRLEVALRNQDGFGSTEQADGSFKISMSKEYRASLDAMLNRRAELRI